MYKIKYPIQINTDELYNLTLFVENFLYIRLCRQFIILLQRFNEGQKLIICWTFVTLPSSYWMNSVSDKDKDTEKKYKCCICSRKREKPYHHGLCKSYNETKFKMLQIMDLISRQLFIFLVILFSIMKVNVFIKLYINIQIISILHTYKRQF